MKKRELRVVLIRLSEEELDEQLHSHCRIVPANLLMDNNRIALNRDDIRDALHAELPQFDDQDREQQQQQAQHEPVNEQARAQFQEDEGVQRERERIEQERIEREEQERAQRERERPPTIRRMDGLCTKPDVLKLDGSLSENWKKFKIQFEIYVTANECNDRQFGLHCSKTCSDTRHWRY